MTNRRVRIFLMGGDDAKWALDTEYGLAMKYLSTFADMVDAGSKADFIHTVDIDATAEAIRLGHFRPHVPVVGAINNHPSHLLTIPFFGKAMAESIIPVPQSAVAAADMDGLGIDYPRRASLCVDEGYRSINRNDKKLVEYKRSLGVPDGKYIIGLLQRDSEGKDLTRPKHQKGADNFAALMMHLKARVGSDRFHVLIGGPRRHWIRRMLKQNDIPYSFAGKDVSGDDYPENILDKETMCLLYNMLDLYVIPTRWEGAPRQLFDVISCRRKIISTPVGIVPEVLSSECIFSSLEEGVEIIKRDMESDCLYDHIEHNYEVVQKNHSIKAVGRIWETVYSELLSLYGLQAGWRQVVRIISDKATQFPHRVVNGFKYVYRNRIKPQKKLSVYHGNSYGAAGIPDFVSDIKRYGSLVCRETPDQSDVCLIYGNISNSGQNVFSVKRHSVNIHFIDETISNAIRSGSEKERHDYIKTQALCSATICTSRNCLEDIVAAGLDYNNPLIIKLAHGDRTEHIQKEESKGDNTVRDVLIIGYDLQPEAISFINEVIKRKINQEITFSVVSDKKAISKNIPWHLSPDFDRRASLAYNHRMMMLFPGLTDSYRLMEYMGYGLPCAYHFRAERHSALIGMSGIPFSDEASAFSGIKSVLSDLPAFRMAIALPDARDAVSALEFLVREI